MGEIKVKLSLCLTKHHAMNIYEGISKRFRTESITKYTLTFGITRCCPLQRVMETKLTRLTHKIVTQLHQLAESCATCCYCSRRPVRKLMHTPSCDGIRVRTNCGLLWMLWWTFGCQRL